MIKNQIVISIYYKNIGFIGQKSAKTANVDDRHVSAPWDSTTMEIALGPQNSE